MSTELSQLLSAEAKKLSRPPERTYEQSFNPYRDSNGNVVWVVLVAGQKPLQKWFKAAAHFPTALEKARNVVAKAGHTGNFTLALEARPTILAKLGGK
jgi:hypothetical protein